MATISIEDVTLTRAGAAPDPPTTSSTPETLSADDVEELFSGYGDGDSGDSQWVSFSLTKGKATANKYPFIRCSKENGFNWLPPAGLQISWEGDQLTLTVDN